MVVLVNHGYAGPGYAGTLGIRYIAGITIGVTNPPVKTRSGRLGGGALIPTINFFFSSGIRHILAFRALLAT